MPDAQSRQFAESLFVAVMLLGSLLEGRSLAQAGISSRPPLSQGPATTITGTLSIVVADLTRGCREKGLCLVLSG